MHIGPIVAGENIGMFAEFSDSARRAMLSAEDAARGLNHKYVGTEHLLLGLTQDESGRDVLRALGVARSRIRSKIERFVTRGPQRMRSADCH